ncbi:MULTISPECIES: TetR/AcrR family transcriptional regulator [Mycolicibacterium]|uniref:TetR family transcriptional regulator n=1 Tax=Mycolicibacterium senegalense TaxID=1796 RepID=A0A378W8L8_9MYCO|nr:MULTISPECIES: TetR family transcriptional regulator [Mycolicibacterium]MCV7336110.1 TetR family transcriptional regulator [Mycolicibacterium senegalense]MDR7287883.1 AcrR family transcriptional regulator [Mycolicibacterium senegalense]QZA24891.1 TetR/AcrR family transcriptional regulator [Mycolicibacterium senegalense]CDP86710.1 TetR family transcriptional regulator [Mycolicibacterium farcinogenes]SUA28541.1 TetR family transcriptional regulator [Mycolicibacterium senegalense]
MSVPAPDASGTTRQKLIDAAIELFRRHSVAGTSLQMISDELGLTKSAIYHHFRTRDELLSAIMEPVISELAELVETAEAQRGSRAQAESMLTGYISLAVAHRDLFPIFTGDPGVAELLRRQPQSATLVKRQADLLAGAEPGVSGQVRAALVMAGISAAVGVDFDGIDDRKLVDELVTATRRTLNLRSPRHKT